MIKVKDFDHENVEEVVLDEKKDDTDWLTIGIGSFIVGHIECCVITYWVLVLAALFMRIFKHKQLGWVDIVK